MDPCVRLADVSIAALTDYGGWYSYSMSAACRATSGDKIFSIQDERSTWPLDIASYMDLENFSEQDPDAEDDGREVDIDLFKDTSSTQLPPPVNECVLMSSF